MTCGQTKWCERPTCHLCNVDVPAHVAKHYSGVEQKRHAQQMQWAQNNLDFHTDELSRLHAELGRLRHRRHQLQLQQNQWKRRKEQGDQDAGWELNRLWNELYRMSFVFRDVLRSIQWNEREIEAARERLDELVAR